MARDVLQGALILPDRVVERGQVVIEDGLIQEVVADEERYQPTEDYGDDFIMPGLIDLHVHGIAGADVMDASQDSIDRMAHRFVMHGVTGFLASTVTQSLDLTRRAIEAVRSYKETPRDGRARVLGIHLEGPFLNPEFKGMQNQEYLRPPSEEVMRDLLECARGCVTRVSLAPELPGSHTLVRLLRGSGIFVSMAHTGATYDQAMDAVRVGVTHVTHCFNAMTGLHHRRPGVAGAAMLCEDLYAELIADGIHIHPAVMQVLIRVKGRERVMLVTDSMSAADMPAGLYAFGGHEVTVRDGVARLADGTLASSTLTMDAAVRNLVRLCGVPLVDAAFMASATPADAMGLGSRKGRLVAGLEADLTVFDSALQPVATWIEGRRHFDVHAGNGV